MLERSGRVEPEARPGARAEADCAEFGRVLVHPGALDSEQLSQGIGVNQAVGGLGVGGLCLDAAVFFRTREKWAGRYERHVPPVRTVQALEARNTCKSWTSAPES